LAHHFFESTGNTVFVNTADGLGTPLKTLAEGKVSFGYVFVQVVLVQVLDALSQSNKLVDSWTLATMYFHITDPALDIFPVSSNFSRGFDKIGIIQGQSKTVKLNI
jgi:hypothetical protein